MILLPPFVGVAATDEEDEGEAEADEGEATAAAAGPFLRTGEDADADADAVDDDEDEEGIDVELIPSDGGTNRLLLTVAPFLLVQARIAEAAAEANRMRTRSVGSDAVFFASSFFLKRIEKR